MQSANRPQQVTVLRRIPSGQVRDSYTLVQDIRGSNNCPQQPSGRIVLTATEA